MTSSDPATIFLAGSSGFIGSSLQRKVAKTNGFRLVQIPRGSPLPAGRCKPNDVVIQAAWPPDGSSWNTFLEWSLGLRLAAAEQGAWFLAFGSGVEAYADHPELKDPYRCYGRQKIALKNALSEVAPGKLAWIRLHFMFGPGERPSRLIPAAVRSGIEGDTFICGALGRRRRWLHVDDQADYLLRFIESPEPGDWDIAGRFDVSFQDLLDLVGRALHQKLRVREDDAPVPDSALDTIVPGRISSVVPADAGNLDSLLGRLTDYVVQLASASGLNQSRVS